MDKKSKNPWYPQNTLINIECKGRQEIPYLTILHILKFSKLLCNRLACASWPHLQQRGQPDQRWREGVTWRGEGQGMKLHLVTKNQT